MMSNWKMLALALALVMPITLIGNHHGHGGYRGHSGYYGYGYGYPYYGYGYPYAGYPYAGPGVVVTTDDPGAAAAIGLGGLFGGIIGGAIASR